MFVQPVIMKFDKGYTGDERAKCNQVTVIRESAADEIRRHRWWLNG